MTLAGLSWPFLSFYRVFEEKSTGLKGYIYIWNTLINVEYALKYTASTGYLILLYSFTAYLLVYIPPYWLRYKMYLQAKNGAKQ